MLIVPLQPIAAQELTVALANQVCRMRLYFRIDRGLFLDLYVNDALIVGGVPCLDRTKIVRDVYFGFVGDLAFIDTQDSQDPVYTELNARYVLGYFSPDELLPVAPVITPWTPAAGTPPPAAPGAPGVPVTD